MKKKIRYNVFETNSSSEHSFIFDTTEKKRNIPTELLDIDYIDVALKDFSESDVVYGYRDKLSYLLTYLFTKQFGYSKEEKLDNLRKDEEFIAVKEALYNHLKCGIQISNLDNAYMNYIVTPSVLIYLPDEEFILNFLFCDEIQIEITPM